VLAVCEQGGCFYSGRRSDSGMCSSFIFDSDRIIRAFLVEEAKIVKAVLASQKQKK
jgi:hypothetical protein